MSPPQEVVNEVIGHRNEVKVTDTAVYRRATRSSSKELADSKTRNFPFETKSSCDDNDGDNFPALPDVCFNSKRTMMESTTAEDETSPFPDSKSPKLGRYDNSSSSEDSSVSPAFQQQACLNQNSASLFDVGNCDDNSVCNNIGDVTASCVSAIRGVDDVTRGGDDLEHVVDVTGHDDVIVDNSGAEMSRPHVDDSDCNVSMV